MKSVLRVKAAHCLSALTLFAISRCASAGNAEHANADASGDHLPGDSVYQLQSALLDQDGKPFKLTDLRGRPVVVSMFYNSCQFVCPMLIDTVRATQDRLSAGER
jgi:protein SCO1/2